MISFYINEKEFELPFNGIGIIQTKNPNLFVKWINEGLKKYGNMRVDNKTYKSYIYISELTQLNQLLNLSKTNTLTQEIINSNNLSKVVNWEYLKEIENNINEKLNINLLDTIDDKYKLINCIIEQNTDIYLDAQLFVKSLNFLKKAEKQLLIINEIEELRIDDLISYLNYFDFLILNHDFRSCVKDISKLEVVNIFNDETQSFFSLVDTNKFISYLEIKLNDCISNKDINSFLNRENNEKNIKIYYFLKKIS